MRKGRNNRVYKALVVLGWLGLVAEEAEPTRSIAPMTALLTF